MGQRTVLGAVVGAALLAASTFTGVVVATAIQGDLDFMTATISAFWLAAHKALVDLNDWWREYA